MQEVKFLCDLPVSLDGLKVERVSAGSVMQIPDDMVASLISEGLIELVLKDKALRPKLRRK